MRKVVLLLLLGATTCLFMVNARAQGFYIGAGVGTANASFNSSDFSAGSPSILETQDKGSMGTKLFAGYQFTRHWGAELGYVDLGKFKYNYDAGAAGTAERDYKVTGYTLSGTGTLSITETLFVFGRVGLFQSTAKASLTNATGTLGAALASAGLTPGSSASASKSNLYFGVGGEWDFLRNLGARLEYEDYGEVGDSDNTGRVKVNLFSLSVLYRF